jgi:hypothetical protein
VTPTKPVTIERAPEPAARGRGPLPSWLLALVSALGGIVAVVLLVVRLMSGDPQTAATGPGEIFLEPAAATGPDPFTPSVATASAPPASAAAVSPSASAEPTVSAAPTAAPSTAIAVRTIPGGTVGLYGGTRNNAECDKAQLIAFLEQNPDKAAAWAAVHRIEPSAIRDYVDGLTPVVLIRDTRVTNHGFRNGAADARQSVLQAGTAVLVDERGVPRARCFCGNPLLEPIPAPVQPSYVGDAWPGFAPEKVEVIAPATVPLAQIPVVDRQTGEVFGRPPGSDGSVDAAVLASAPPLASAEPSAVVAATPTEPAATSLPGPGQGEPVARAPVFASDLTGIGAVGATSIDPNFPIGGAVDLDPATSWFSIGPHSSSTVIDYTWSVSGPVEIGAVLVAGNGENATPEFRTGFGFARVDIAILQGGSLVTSVSHALDGTPDPNAFVEFPEGTFGDTVRMRFSGPESLDCGGVAEVLVLGPEWEADIDRLIDEGLGDFLGT